MKPSTIAFGLFWSMIAAPLGCGAGGTPSVEIESASPTELRAGDDAANDLHIAVRYEDGDGDLGGGVAEVHDCRAKGLVTRLSLPAIASKQAVDEGVAIAGELDLVVADVTSVAEGAADSVCNGAGADRRAFCVVLVDSAHHASDPACTDPITVVSAP